MSSYAQNLNCTSLSFGHNVISFSVTEKNLGFHFTDDMGIDAHVQDICRKVYIDIRCISSIRYLLTIDATKTLLSDFMLPKLDYCNSLIYDGSMYMPMKRQKVQKSSASVIFQCRKQNHISPLLMSLHWLPINGRIKYKVTVICHSFFSCISPSYLSELLTVFTPKGNLRSSSDNSILCITKLRKNTFGYRSFSFADPTILNSLPT